ncbi:hypothetical protein EVAR_80366_1 [Eumeta japonica]|uniref:Uncharacterized protein n=1 Tax=Eumeta variegata TaxID=151549 RepID=A0A4C1X0X8_EUMVA|nr:hypothetical protein EVAR_80366_1 [Eumeta japonica]
MYQTLLPTLIWRSNAIPLRSPLNGQPPFARRRIPIPIPILDGVTFQMDFITVQRRENSRSKPEVALIFAQTTDGSGFLPKNPKKHPTLLKPYYFSLSVASQVAIVEKHDKVAAPTAVKNINKKKSEDADE